jgi:hypothetical protein
MGHHLDQEWVREAGKLRLRPSLNLPRPDIRETIATIRTNAPGRGRPVYGGWIRWMLRRPKYWTYQKRVTYAVT